MADPSLLSMINLFHDDLEFIDSDHDIQQSDDISNVFFNELFHSSLEPSPQKSASLKKIASNDILGSSSDSGDASTSSEKSIKPKSQSHATKKGHLFKSRYPSCNITFLNTPQDNHIKHSKAIIKNTQAIPFSVQPSASLNRSIGQYGVKLSELSNAYDAKGLMKLVEKCTNSNCLVSLTSPTVNFEVVGSSVIVNLMTEIFDLYPDCIMRVLYTKEFTDNKGQRCIKTKLAMTGTLVKSKAIPECVDKFKTDSATGLVSEMLDDNSSTQTKAAIKEKELKLRSSGKLVRCEYELVLKLYIDGFTGKIGMSTSKSRLIRIVN